MKLCVIGAGGEQYTAFSFQLGRDNLPKTTVLGNPAELNYSSYDHVLLIGFFPTVITRDDIKIPRQIGRRDLTASVQYKFAHNLPVDPNDIWWEYRVKNAQVQNTEYEICASSINKDEFAKQIAFLEKSGIKIDQCILTPLLISEDIFPGIGKFGSPVQENFFDYIQKEQSSEYGNFVRTLNADIPDSVKLSFFAFYMFARASKANIGSIVSSEGMIPGSMRPERYKFLRKINLILMLFAIIFASVVLIERSNRSYAHYETLEQENSKLRQELKELQTQSFRLAEEEKLLKEYRDSNIGYAGFEELLLEITQKIPSYMWVKSFRLSGNTLELTVESTKDDVNFYNTMKSGKLYELKNLRKNKGRGDGFDYSVTLELVAK